MLCEISIRCNAKVNLGLKVLPKRSDGYHNIESIFQTVPLSDELNVALLEDEKENCVVECEGMELPENNTIVAASKVFNDLTGNKNSVRVVLKKKIPFGGGLGGGSSDAASFLKALCELKKVPLTEKLADFVAEKVGSDVFFFLHCFLQGKGEGAAVVTGRGEIVKPIELRRDLHFVLLFPDVHSSTKEAYGLVDKDLSAGVEVKNPDRSVMEKMYGENPEKWTFKNSFSEPLMKNYPEIKDALSDINALKPCFSDMSGSGSTVFGVFKTLDEAKNAFGVLNKNWNGFAC